MFDVLNKVMMKKNTQINQVAMLTILASTHSVMANSVCDSYLQSALLQNPVCAPVSGNRNSSNSTKWRRSRWWRISVPNQQGDDFARAYIGRRASADEGSKAAFRMLSRLIRWYPKEVGFEVDFSYVSTGSIEKKGNLMYVPHEHLIVGKPSKWNVNLVGVSRSTIHRVARRSEKFDDLPKYGAVDFKHPVEVDLGRQTSSDSGNRAALLTLARLINKPLQTPCDINWHIIRQDGLRVKMALSYDPRYKVVDIDSVVLGNSEKSSIERYINVSRKAIFNVARKKGVFQDLLRFDSRVKKEIYNG